MACLLQIVWLDESFLHLKFKVHSGGFAPVEICIQLTFAAYAHEDAALELDFLLALHFLGPPQVQKIVDIDLGLFLHVSPFWVGGCLLLMVLLNLLDFLVSDGLGIERHLP